MKVHFWDKIAQQSLWLCKNVLFVVVQERFTCGYTRTFCLKSDPQI